MTLTMTWTLTRTSRSTATLDVDTTVDLDVELSGVSSTRILAGSAGSTFNVQGGVRRPRCRQGQRLASTSTSSSTSAGPGPHLLHSAAAARPHVVAVLALPVPGRVVLAD